MGFKYKVVENGDGYKMVNFQHSFCKALKKDFKKQSNKYYKMLEENHHGEQFTPIPTQYNPIAMKSALDMEYALDNGGIVGFLLESDEVFKKVNKKIFDNELNCVTLNIEGQDLIICSNDQKEIKDMKSFIYSEILKDKSVSKKIDEYEINNLDKTEQEHIQDIFKETILDMMELGQEVPESIVILTQIDLSKVVVNNKKLKDVQKLFELLNISNAVVQDSIYFNKRQTTTVKEYLDKLMNKQIIFTDKVYEIKKTGEKVVLENKEVSKPLFDYKNIEEIIKDKTHKDKSEQVVVPDKDFIK